MTSDSKCSRQRCSMLGLTPSSLAISVTVFEPRAIKRRTASFLNESGRDFLCCMGKPSERVVAYGVSTKAGQAHSPAAATSQAAGQTAQAAELVPTDPSPATMGQEGALPAPEPADDQPPSSETNEAIFEMYDEMADALRAHSNDCEVTAEAMGAIASSHHDDLRLMAAPLCANVGETSTRSEISVEGAMDLQDEEIEQGNGRT